MNTPTLPPFIPTCLASVSWDFSVLLSSVPWCVLRASHKRAAGLVMKHWFSFTGIIQPRCVRRGTIPGVLSGLHTHLPCGLVLAELSVLPVGPAGHNPVVTPPSEFAVCVFLGSLSPAGGTFYLCQERSPCVTEEDFFVYLYSLARSLIFLPVQCEGIPSCPLFVLGMAQGALTAPQTQLGAAVVLQREITILDPAEPAAHWGAPCRAKAWEMFSWVRCN